ncbi:uroporphyrinogen decarboxylase family protein [Bifidobacterium aquikefiri]|uniref:uroporphyrinogen decarboxylase family protein n=1 Tax=Bifidobacterium aquikefiri TaxID=1653207 RepID=UPI0039E7CB8F
MTTTRREQFHAMLEGGTDVPAFLTSAWQHFIGHEYGAEEFAKATIDFNRKWNWDWIKINSRAVYYAEAWGSIYDHFDYPEIPEPKPIKAAIANPDDLKKVSVLDVKSTPEFADHLTAARLIREAFPDRAIVQTIFNPLSVLMQMALLPLYPGANSTGTQPTTSRDELIFEHPEAAKKPIGNIAETLAAYAASLVTPIADGGSGLDGIFLASTGMASEDYFDAKQYEAFAKPYDSMVIAAVNSANPRAKIIFHTCRQEAHPEWFSSIGAQALQWDQFLEGNPDLDAPFGIVPIGGASFTEFATEGDTTRIARELEETIQQRSGKPFLLAPSCTIPTPASDDALQLLRNCR